jgi:HNH endonuclease
MTTKPNASDRNYDPTALFQRNTGAKRPISRYTSTIARWLNTNLVHGRQATTPVRNGWLHRLRLCKRKADCTSNRLKGCGWSLGTEKVNSRAWMLLFTTSQCGLQINSGIGERDSNEQTAFRKELLTAYDAENPGGDIWDPIIGDWFPAEHCNAAHIFPYRHGQEVMTTLFGPEVEGELFSPRNGLLLHDLIENRLDAGLFVIVPDINDIRDAGEVLYWSEATLKAWKIKILDWKWPKLDNNIDRPGLTWRQLDGRKLQFRNAFRPRARFLYFNYCVQVLRYAWNHPGKPPPLKDELGKRYWGSMGRYVYRNFIRGIADECGHEYDHLFEGSAELQSAGRDAAIERDIGLALACGQIKGEGDEDDNGDDDDLDGTDKEDEMSIY